MFSSLLHDISTKTHYSIIGVTDDSILYFNWEIGLHNTAKVYLEIVPSRSSSFTLQRRSRTRSNSWMIVLVHHHWRTSSWLWKCPIVCDPRTFQLYFDWSVLTFRWRESGDAVRTYQRGYIYMWLSISTLRDSSICDRAQFFRQPTSPRVMLSAQFNYLRLSIDNPLMRIKRKAQWFAIRSVWRLLEKGGSSSKECRGLASGMEDDNLQ